ncbi:MAG TPA: 50S ribosomal protein L4 [Chromatiales bacterium]|nr:50S ribosomal protein L4 [Chromatiales bacterium]
MEVRTVDSGEAVQLAEGAFGAAFNEPLVHQAVTAYLAGGRAGTKAQKSRSDVRGGGAKPWRQKGTGRARAGSIRSPLWRGGGVTFAARPRNHRQKLNKKMYRAAMRSILSELVRTERLVVMQGFAIEAPKTRELVARLQELDLSSVLIVVPEVNRELGLAARNLVGVDVVEPHELNPVNLLSRDKVLMTVEALRKVEEWLA